MQQYISHMQKTEQFCQLKILKNTCIEEREDLVTLFTADFFYFLVDSFVRPNILNLINERSSGKWKCGHLQREQAFGKVNVTSNFQILMRDKSVLER